MLRLYGKTTVGVMTKLTKQWLKVRREWIKLNPPNHQGYYICWRGDWVLQEDMELDHIIPRSNRPDLRFVHSNLRPSCSRHNREKGSKHGTVY